MSASDKVVCPSSCFRVNAMLNQPLVSGDTEGDFEGPGKVTGGESAFACNVSKPDTALQVLMEKLRGSPLLPWRKTSS